MTPAEARELLAMVEAFLLRPPRRGKRTRIRVRTSRPPHSLDHDYDLRAWGCVSVTVTEDDCDLSQHVSESILQEHHEDAGEQIDQAKVREAEKLPFEACKGASSYQQDTSVVVLLRDEAAE